MKYGYEVDRFYIIDSRAFVIYFHVKAQVDMQIICVLML